MRTIIVVIYVFLFLILGLPVLGIEWIIAKFDKHAADISQLRIVQWTRHKSGRNAQHSGCEQLRIVIVS